MNESYVAEYLRVSDDDEDIGGSKKESDSIVNQRRVLESFIRNQKDLAGYPVKEFVDDGVSGVNFKRPGIQSLFHEVRENHVVCIVVKDLSRFGRNYIEVGDYIEQIFPFMGVRFISVSDNFDSFKNSAGLEIGFKNLMHDLYSRDLSKKIKTAKVLHQKEGAYSGGDVPYGYIRNNGEGSPYIPDPDAAQTVRKIFQLAADGNTTSMIADRLNEEGILIPGIYKNQRTNAHYELKNEKCSLWSASQVNLIIRNEVYIGTYIGNKLSTVQPGMVKKNDKSKYIKIENHHEKLVEAELFREAQKVIRVQRKKRTSGVSKNASILKGKVKCGCCGYSMSFKCTAKRSYFYCRMGKSCASYNQIGQEQLESTVRNALLKLAEIYCKQNQDCHGKRTEILKVVSQMKEDKRMLEIQTENCKAGRMEAYHRWKEGWIEKEEYIIRKDELTQRETECRKKLDMLNQKLADILSVQHRSKEKSRLDAVIKNQGLTKELVDELIERIEIYSGDRVEMKWKFHT